MLIKKCENNDGENLHVWVNRGRSRNDEDLQNFKDGLSTLGKIIKIEEPQYTTVYKAKTDVLNEKEREYLSNVIKPFKDKILSIGKEEKDDYNEYITIYLEDEDFFLFPNFKKGTMYKEMKDGGKYSLKDLGLD